MVRNLTSRFLLLLLLALAAACQPSGSPLPTTTAVPASLPVRALISPAILPILPAVQVCSRQDPSLALFVEPLPARANPPAVTDIYVFLASEQTDSEKSYALGIERLVIVVHPENRLARLGTGTVREIFSGRIRDWSGLEASTDITGPIRLWSYTAANPLGELFSSVLFEAGGAAAQDFALAPGPAAMIEAVAADPNAIGYVPGGWLNASVREVTLDEQLADRWQIPILAGVTDQPEASVAALLSCLQSGEGQRLVQEIYHPLE